MGVFTKKAMSINGEYIENLIDGYNTLDVNGRESLSASLQSNDKITDGSEFVSRRYTSRTLTVSFVIQDEGGYFPLRKKLEKLASILNVTNAQVIFDDEPDKYFIASLGENLNFSLALGIATGSFELYCADPFKYDVEETVVTLDSEPMHDGDFSYKVFTTENDGHSVFPRFEVRFGNDPTLNESGEIANPRAGDCGYVMFTRTNRLNLYNAILGYAPVQAGVEYRVEGINANDTLLFSLTPTGTTTEVETFIRKDANGAEYNSLRVTSNGYLRIEQAPVEPSEDEIINDDGDIDPTEDIDIEPEALRVLNVNPSEYSIQFGNDQEKNTTVPTFTSSFYAPANDWVKDTGVHMLSSSYVCTTSGAAVGAVKSTGVHPTSYGSNTAKVYHGPAIVKNLGHNVPGNFTFAWKQVFDTTAAGQMGCFQIGLLDENKYPVYLLNLLDSSTKASTVQNAFYRFDAAHNPIRVSWPLTSFGDGKTGPLGRYAKVTKTKKGKKTVKKTTYPLRIVPNYISRTIDDEGIPRITVRLGSSTLTFEDSIIQPVRYAFAFFGQYSNVAAIAENYIYNASFTGDPVDSENSFGSNELLEVDCRDMSVYLNNAPNPNLGDIGNDWLGMKLDTGINVVTCQWSGGTGWENLNDFPPVPVMYYRKRYI